MWAQRLGDDLDDYCIKCKRLTNHTIVSLVEEKPAKVRCRTCYNDHDYRHEQAPPTKKELAAQALMQELLASGGKADELEAPVPDPSSAPAAKKAAKKKSAG